MAYLKTLTECTYALLYGYKNSFIKRVKVWEKEAVIDEDEFLFPAPTSLGNSVGSRAQAQDQNHKNGGIKK